MTLTERKLNPEITAVLARTLTEPEMEQAAGGDYNRKLIILCDQLGIHDFVFTGKYQYVEHPLCGYYRSEVYKCSRCGKHETRNQLWYVGTDKVNEY